LGKAEGITAKLRQVFWLRRRLLLRRLEILLENLINPGLGDTKLWQNDIQTREQELAEILNLRCIDLARMQVTQQPSEAFQ